MFSLKTPVIVTVIGEGGSGGALGIGIGDKVMIMEYSYYSVISPEGCAAILWKDAARREDAARVLKLTAPELIELGVVDEVIPEPQGGAHRDYQQASKALKDALVRSINDLSKKDIDQLLGERYNKFRAMGVFKE